MATEKLSKAAFVQRGYGQVEPNHLSAPRNGRVYAQLPAGGAIQVLENGQFVQYNKADGVCKLEAAGKGPWMMVFNEVKIYRDFETDADFAMKKGDYVARVYSAAPQDMPPNTSMVPRVFDIGVGDLWTTNTIDEATLTKGDKLYIDGATGYLKKDGDVTGVEATVVKVYTMPDGQKGAQLQCTAVNASKS